MKLETDVDVRGAYSADASGLCMTPESVARPASGAEIAELLREAHASKTPVTCAGGQTSTTGASITDQGILLSLRGMAGVIDIDTAARTMRVEAGAFVGDVKRAAAAQGLLFAPDPTSEEECTIGGAIACNASGARTFKYGATRRYVKALKVALSNGEITELRRSDLEKNTVGYAFAHDPIDWFIGSEGTLGVVIEAELSLLPLPERVVGLGIPFPDEASALGFIVAARESLEVKPRCLEYLDALTFPIARATDDQPGWASDASTLVYTEQEIGSGEELDDVLGLWLALAEEHNADADIRVFDTDAQIRQARKMRHNVPATMNERSTACKPQGGRKISTDWAVPYRRLGEALRRSREIASKHGFEEPFVFGHAGNGHPHLNFIARDADELVKKELVVEEILREVIAMGGTIAAEHGIGKIKRRWIDLQMNPMQMGMMRAVKRELDPNGILAPGNIL